MTAPAWPHLYREGSPESPVLLMLHGTGGNEREIAALAESLDPSAAVLAPRGPVQESGMLRWFRRFAEGRFDVDDVVRRSGELAGFIAEARTAYGLADRRLVAVGFSNGANIALATALLHPESVDRAVAFSGMDPLPDRDLDSDLSGSRVLLMNGDSDPMAPLASAKRVVAVLAEGGAEVDHVVRPGGHGIVESDLRAAVDWLAAHEVLAASPHSARRADA